MRKFYLSWINLALYVFNILCHQSLKLQNNFECCHYASGYLLATSYRLQATGHTGYWNYLSGSPKHNLCSTHTETTHKQAVHSVLKKVQPVSLSHQCMVYVSFPLSRRSESLRTHSCVVTTAWFSIHQDNRCPKNIPSKPERMGKWRVILS